MSTSSIVAGAAYVRLLMDDKQAAGSLEKTIQRFKSFSGALIAAGEKIDYAMSGTMNAMRGALSVFSGFDDRMRMVKAVTNATGTEFDMLREKAKKLGRETAFTASQVGDAMISLGRMGFKPKEIDQSVESVMALSSATGTELAAAAEIAAANLRVFDLDASEMIRVADLLTATANGSAQSLADLGESMKMSGPQIKIAGETIEDACAALGILANMGIRGSLAGTALANSYRQLADSKTREYLKQYNLETTDANGNLRKMRDILVDMAKVMRNMPSAEKINFTRNVFDVRGSLGGGVLVRDVGNIDAFLEKLENSSGTALRTMQEMESGIGGTTRAFLSAAEGVAIAFGEVFSPMAISFGKYLTGILLQVRLWISENAALVRNLASVAASVTAFSLALKTLGLASSVFTMMLSPLLKLPIALRALSSAMHSLNAAAYANSSTMRFFGTVNTKTLASALRLAAGGKGITAVFYAKALAMKAAAGAVALLDGAMKTLLAHPVIASIAAAVGIFILLKTHADALTESIRKANETFKKMSDESYNALTTGDKARMKNKVAAERLKELEALSKKAKLTAAQVREAQELLNRFEFGSGEGTWGKIEDGRLTLNEDPVDRTKENDRAWARRQEMKALHDAQLKLIAARRNQENVMQGRRFDLNFWSTDDKRIQEFKEKEKETLAIMQRIAEIRKRIRDLDAGVEGAETGNAVRAAADAEAEKNERWIDPAKLSEAESAANAYEEEMASKRKGRSQAEIDALHKKQAEYRKQIELLLEQERIELRIANRALKRADTPENRKGVSEREKKIAELETRLRESMKQTALEEEAVRRKRAEAESAYTGFRAEFEKERAAAEEDRALELLRKSSKSDWEAKLGELVKTRQNEIRTLWKQYDASLRGARMENSEEGSEISGSEGKKLRELQEEIRRRQEEINSYRDRIESGRRELEKREERMDVNGSFSGAALARMLHPDMQLEMKKVNYLKKIAEAAENSGRNALVYG